uniref:7TM_GPCR_Srx domain-containing protein n=1 Tax=Caenorhabditis tropicalis TaxID=1561998 RepID=A0A1I7SYK5_9PELO
MLWISEDAPCSLFHNTLNITTAGKLVFDKVAGMSVHDSQMRRRMYIRKFSQCVLQDCLHAFDMINCSFTYQIDLKSDWLQFLCFSVSFVTIHALDGLVMLFFHADVQPKWLRKPSVKISNISVAPAS